MAKTKLERIHLDLSKLIEQERKRMKDLGCEFGRNDKTSRVEASKSLAKKLKKIKIM